MNEVESRTEHLDYVRRKRGFLSNIDNHIIIICDIHSELVVGCICL